MTAASVMNFLRVAIVFSLGEFQLCGLWRPSDNVEADWIIAHGELKRRHGRPPFAIIEDLRYHPGTDA
jgi:hypothetical protein